MPELVTERLRLVPITLDAIEAVLDHDRTRAEAIVGATFPRAWPNDELVAQGFPFSREALRSAPDVRLWGDSLILLKDAPMVVGSVVFHGHPGAKEIGPVARVSSADPGPGVAEVAYGIAEPWRRKGFAIEATLAAVEWALLQDGIAAVQATTFPWHAASLGVIKRLGMEPVGTREHDTLGELLVFERRR
jgi:[ribosomal protein S5]-alanine N-acetyltransferase